MIVTTSRNTRGSARTMEAPSFGRRSAAPFSPIPQQPGNQFLQLLLAGRGLQAKLTVDGPGDRYEQQADRVADQVMRMPEPVPAAARPDTLSTGLQIQRVCPECEGELQRQPDEEEEEMVQAKESPGWTPVVSNSMVQRIRGLRSGGSPLPPSDRSFFEPRFGVSFSQVRVHTDVRASKMAKSVNARAFTFGNDIVFRAGEFASHTLSGRRLLAHELTHVVQQNAAPHSAGRVSVRNSLPAIGPRPLQRQPFGIRLPSGLRRLDSTERGIAKSVYGQSIQLYKVLLSNALGFNGRPFTVYVPIPILGGVTVINIGPSAYKNPGSDKDLLIHELAHSWQSQHHLNPAQYMVNSVASQTAAAITGGSAYCYKPGKAFGFYGAEQIAQQVENREAPIVSHVKSKAPGSVDLANILSLSIPRWEKRGDPGVKCPA